MSGGEGGENGPDKKILQFPPSKIRRPLEEMDEKNKEALLQNLDTLARKMYDTLLKDERVKSDPTLSQKREGFIIEAKDLLPEQFADWLQTPKVGWLQSPAGFFILAELYLKKRGLLEK